MRGLRRFCGQVMTVKINATSTTSKALTAKAARVCILAFRAGGFLSSTKQEPRQLHPRD